MNFDNSVPSFRGIALACFAITMVSQASLHANPIAPSNPTNNLITWGQTPSATNILLSSWGTGDDITFQWTAGGQPSKNYLPYAATNDTTSSAGVGFTVPKDPTLTDYNLTYHYNGGRTITLTAVALTNTEPNVFSSLNNLPTGPYQIPLLGPGPIPIYAYVNLTQYVADNPLGPLNGNYAAGQSLDGLGLDVVGGQIPGIQGLYFATTPFAYDPNSIPGYTPTGGPSTLLDSAAFESQFGPLQLGNVVTGAVPEPSTYLLVGSLLAGLVIFERRRKSRP